MKKLLSILLCLLMITSMISGCAKKETASEDTASNADQATATQGATEDSSQASDDSQASDEVVTIKMYTMSMGNGTDYLAVQDAINAISVPEIGVKVEWTLLDIGQWFQQVNMFLAGSEEIDLMPMLGGVTSAVAQGSLLELDDLYAQYGQGMPAYISTDILEGGKVNGKLYGITSQKDFASQMAILYDKTIVDELGLDVSNVKTLADWTPILEAVHKAHPDIAPFVSAAGSTLSNFNTYNWDKLGDNLGVLLDYGATTQVVNLYESDIYKEYVTLFRDWYNKGLIAKDTATATQTFTDFMAAGTAFSSWNGANPGTLTENTLKVGREVGVIPVTVPYSATGNVNTLLWTIPATSKNPEAAMKFLNLMYTNADIVDLLNYGIEGTHYQVNEDGTFKYLEGQDISTCTYHPNMEWVWPNTYIGSQWEGSTPNIGSKMTEFNNSSMKSSAMGFVFDNAAVINEVTACQNVVKEYSFALESGAVDPEKALPEFQQALKDVGIDKIITEKQNQLDAWLANK